MFLQMYPAEKFHVIKLFRHRYGHLSRRFLNARKKYDEHKWATWWRFCKICCCWWRMWGFRGVLERRTMMAPDVMIVGIFFLETATFLCYDFSRKSRSHLLICFGKGVFDPKTRAHIYYFYIFTRAKNHLIIFVYTYISLNCCVMM